MTVGELKQIIANMPDDFVVNGEIDIFKEKRTNTYITKILGIRTNSINEEVRIQLQGVL